MDPFKRFKLLLETCVSEKSVIFLEKLWAEKTRFYHNTTHLIQILKDIESNIWFTELFPFEKKVLLLAAFFHDAIYDPKKKDNEDQSINFFKASWIGHDEFVYKEVIKLIEVTKHRKRPVNRLAQIFWDADNAGFKGGYTTLLKNEKLIRKEYKFVPVAKYREARLKFIEENIGLFNSNVDKDLKKLAEFVEKTYK